MRCEMDVNPIEAVVIAAGAALALKWLIEMRG